MLYCFPKTNPCTDLLVVLLDFGENWETLSNPDSISTGIHLSLQVMLSFNICRLQSIKLILYQYNIFLMNSDNPIPELEFLVALERTGALRLLVSLLQGDRFISELIRRHDNQGIASQPALEKTRTELVKIRLIEEHEVFNELTRKTRLYVGLTHKGREVAEGILKVAGILSN